MTLKNAKLINLINKIGNEETVATMLQSKIDHDAKQKVYHAKRNALQSMLTRELKSVAARDGKTLDTLLHEIVAEKAKVATAK